MADAAFEEKLREAPLAFKLPCHGCVHNAPATELYRRCTQMDGRKVPFWVRFMDFSVIAAKAIYGPFTDDAREYHCPTRRVLRQGEP